MNELLTQLLSIAKEAAGEILDVYQRPFEVDFKTPRDPVTEADRRSNELICQRLESLSPGTVVVAEESPESLWSHFRDHQRVFFVDPLDGTREFVARSDRFVVMIGLLEGERPTHGVMYSPVSRQAWVGSVGDGAWKISADGLVTPLAIQEPESLAQAVIVSSRGEPDSLAERAITLLGGAEVLPVHSAGLKAAAIATGEGHVYLAPTSAGCRWDSCAPEAIVVAAGGTYTDARGRPLDYRAPRLENDSGIVAGPRNLHATVVDRIATLLS